MRKALAVYDSFFGNTENIARAIGDALSAQMDAEVCRVGDVQPAQLMDSTLLIVGSPTRGFRPSPATSKLLKSIPKNGLKGVRVAAFDTRFAWDKIESSAPILAPLVRIFGYAAKPIADRLGKKGGELVALPEGFLVEDTEGPLQAGELERAANWARQIAITPTTCWPHHSVCGTAA